MYKHCRQLRTDRGDVNCWCQDTMDSPALHSQEVFASRKGTSFNPLHWAKCTLVKWTHHSSCWLLFTTCSWTEKRQLKQRQNKPTHKIPTCASWPQPWSCCSPHKCHSHPSLHLPSTQACAHVCSQPGCGPKQTQGLILVQTNYSGRGWKEHGDLERDPGTVLAG